MLVMSTMGIVLSGCAGQMDQVKELNKQNHKVNKIEREIEKERTKKVTLKGTVLVAQDKISQIDNTLAELQDELAQEKAALVELVQ